MSFSDEEFLFYSVGESAEPSSLDSRGFLVSFSDVQFLVFLLGVLAEPHLRVLVAPLFSPDGAF